jgi:DNA-binding LytR/AlgR family response regulator
MKKQKNKKQRINIHILTSGEAFPTVLEMETSKEEVIRHFEKLGARQQPAGRDKLLFVPDAGGFRQIKAEDIACLEAERSYCTIHFINAKSLLVSVPMSTLAACFYNSGFIRVHRSHVINPVYIKCIAGNTITMQNGEQLTIGREYRKSLYAGFHFIGTKSRKYNVADDRDDDMA